MDGREITIEDLCSVEIGQTAKGEWQIKSVKVYCSYGNLTEAADRAVQLGVHIEYKFNQLCMNYVGKV